MVQVPYTDGIALGLSIGKIGAVGVLDKWRERYAVHCVELFANPPRKVGYLPDSDSGYGKGTLYAVLFAIVPLCFILQHKTILHVLCCYSPGG
jgi:hypothetical protein